MGQNFGDIDAEAHGFRQNDADFSSGPLTTEPTIFVITPTGNMDDSLQSHISTSGLRLLGSASFADAALRLTQIATVRMVWIAYDESAGDALTSRLATMADMDVMQLVVSCPSDAIDAAYAHFAATPHVLLCDPSDMDQLITLAMAWETPTMAVHDVLHDPSQGELSKLYDEVTRISQMLTRMTQADANTLSGGLSGAHSPFGGGNYGGASASPFIDDHVAAPSRSYHAQPPINPATLPTTPSYAPSQRAEAVRRLIRARRMREQYFPSDMFADPAWDMLLDLYAAKLERAQVSVSSLCIAAAVPATTALRWIKSMTDTGLFVREADPHDGRRVFIALGDRAKAALDTYFAMAEREGVAAI